jgi:hypothetical protein
MLFLPLDIGEMEVNMKDYLPLGTFVQIRGKIKRFMICGRVQQQIDNGVIWDYSACGYPEGIINPNKLFLFNKEDIDRIYFVGMQDTEELEFREYILQKQDEVDGNGE